MKQENTMSGNKILGLKISDLLHDGRGVGRINGKAYFVEGAIPPETIEFRLIREKRNFGEGRVSKIVSPSAHRVDPRCEYFSRCGGCTLQHLEHNQQIKYKKQQVLNNLQRIQVHPENTLPSLIGPKWHYRRRARLAVQRARDGQFLVGFRNAGTNRIEPISRCLVLDKALDSILTALPLILKDLPRDIKISEIELLAADNALAVSVEASKSLEKAGEIAIFNALSMVNDIPTQLWWKSSKKSQFQRIGENDKPLYVHVSDDIKLNCEPGQFIQVNSDINRQMIDQLLDLLPVGNRGTVVDLFCGSGNLSLPLAQHFDHLVGVEGLKDLVDRATENAQSNGIHNVRFIIADLNDAASLKTVTKLAESIDLVVLDPPRSGAPAVMSWINNSGAKRVIYISCHPATMVRDTTALVQNGYKLKNIGVIDMFPHTAHIETMALFEK
jgi:23S rRNA (uracil1939-C5)-methyltransferase